MKKCLIILSLMISVSLALKAQTGNMQASFIDENLGTRALGMGGANTVLVNDPSALIWNPAGLTNMQANHNVIAEQSEIMKFFSASFLGYGYRMTPDIYLGVGAMHSGDEVMNETIVYLALAGDAANLLDSTFKSELIRQDLLAWGLNIKYFNSSFGNNSDGNYWDFFGQNHHVSGSAHGYGLDLGFIFRPFKRDHFGVTFKNIIADIHWNSSNEAGTAAGKYRESLPLNWTTGYARKQESFNFAIDITKSLHQDVEDILRTGVEYFLTDDLTIRGGYSQELVTADGKQFSLGAGIKVPIPHLADLKINISYLVYKEWEGHDSFLFSVQLP